MEQKKYNQNLILILILSFFMIYAWNAYQMWVNPPKPAAKTAKKTDKGKDLAAKGDQKKPDGAKAEPVKAEVKKEDPKKAEKPKLVEKKPAAPHREVVLGDKTSYIQATANSRGAGVTRLTLNAFQAANSLGRPEDSKFEMYSTQHNELPPAYALAHYDKHEDARPLEALGELEWETEEIKDPTGKRWEVRFSADVPGLDARIIKTFTLEPGDYHIGLSVKLIHAGHTKDNVKIRYQLATGRSLPIEGEWYTSIFRNAFVGGFSKDNRFWRDYQDGRTVAHHSGGDAVLRGEGGRIVYAAVAIQYFASALAVDNLQENRNFLSRARPTLEPPAPPRDRSFLADVAMRVVSEPVDLKPGDKPVEHKYVLYNGPIKVKLLGDRFGDSPPVATALINRYVDDLKLDTLTDYHMQGPGPFVWISENITSPMGWTYLLVSSTNLMHRVLDWLYQVIPNYGICIILLTLMVRALLYPISRRQALSTRNMQEKMKALAPELKVLKEKHKEDFKAFSQAQHELYRKHNVNPLAGMTGCLPILAQMPIFMGLYYCLQESIHFRLAPFLWMVNLSAPDMMIWWGQNIPWISDPTSQGGFLYLGPYFNLLPAVSIALQLVHMRQTMPPPTDEQQEMQQKMTKYMMIFMFVLFYKFASGLCLYFIVSSTWGMIERKMLPKKKDTGTDPAPSSSSNGASRPTTSKPTSKSLPRKPADRDGKLQKVKDMWEELLKQAKKK